MVQFDTVIGNPPYSKSLHLDIINSVLPFMSKRATGCFVHPATWLINVRKNGKAKLYDDLKKKLEGHIKSIDVENLNKKFGTLLRMPFSITEIDMSKTYKDIDFICCGEYKKVNSLYDCNLIGDYKTIWSILDKVKKYGDMMKDHIAKKQYGEKYYYIKYQQKIGNNCLGCASVMDRVGMKYENDSLWTQTKNGDFAKGFVSTAYHYYNNGISDKLHCLYDRGKHLTDTIADNLYGTKEELENWKHFIFNNKLPIFINIVVTDGQDNTSKDFLPWLVDKQYTDDEINTLFGFTKDEIKFMDDTLKKFERHSSWFKRYMCGKEEPNKVTTMEDSPKRKKETPVKPEASSPSSSETSKQVVDDEDEETQEELQGY